ncbi:MAG TPA: thiamine phosphate synthase, partial [Sandaracinaceae bacterium LLY-WYZ-13_1]|nr:thiamine phosphate synthase [Sandaracinaceae bacterium LLY-WYZ-13_1]
MRFALMLVTDPALGEPVAKTEAALAAAPSGRVAVQARMKGAPARGLADLVRALAPICRAAGAPLFVNDRADVARACGADGVHLPERGLRVDEARAVLGPGAWIGRSCHDRAGLERAARGGASYATLAPIGR